MPTIEDRSEGQDTWRPDWDAIADQIVNRTFRLQRGERVVYLADPYHYPECLDSVRAAVLDAGGIEQATLLNWTPRLSAKRTPRGTSADAEQARQEQYAHMDVLNSADIFMWLPNDFLRPGAFTGWESEWMLARWRGRGIHFHWFPDPGTRLEDPINLELQKVYQRALLELDYAALAARQTRMVEAMRGKSLRVTTADGTDITIGLPADGWYHKNDGDMSRERGLQAVAARDREQELPCGAVRAVPSEHSVNGILSLRRTPAWNGFGLNLSEFGDHLDLVFKNGRIVELRGGPRQDALDAARAQFRGDWDRLGEIVIGTNPLLETPAGAKMPTYWGFGEGVFRFHLGDNIESAGRFSSNLWINMFLTDTTVQVVEDPGGETLISDGRLVLP